MHVKLKHFKSAYVAKHMSLNTYKAKKAFEEYVSSKLDDVMSELNDWEYAEPEPVEPTPEPENIGEQTEDEGSDFQSPLEGEAENSEEGGGEE